MANQPVYMYVYYMPMVLQSATDGLLLQVVLVKAVGRVHISDPHHIQYCHFYFVGGGGLLIHLLTLLYSKQKQKVLNHNSD